MPVDQNINIVLIIIIIFLVTCMINMSCNNGMPEHNKQCYSFKMRDHNFKKQ